MKADMCLHRPDCLGDRISCKLTFPLKGLPAVHTFGAPEGTFFLDLGGNCTMSCDREYLRQLLQKIIKLNDLILLLVEGEEDRAAG